MNKDFVTVPNASGNNNGSFNVTCEQNTGDERSTILTVSGGGVVNKTIAITQKTSILENIEIAGGVYASNGNLVDIRSFGMVTDVRLSMTGTQVGDFIFPTPIQEMRMIDRIPTSFLRVQIDKEIPSSFRSEKVINFYDDSTAKVLYVPKKNLTVDIRRIRNKYLFELRMANGINIDNTEIININSALNNNCHVAIVFTNNKFIHFKNFIWRAVYHER